MWDADRHHSWTGGPGQYLGRLLSPVAVLVGGHMEIATCLVHDRPGHGLVDIGWEAGEDVDVFGQRGGNQLIWHGASCHLTASPALEPDYTLSQDTQKAQLLKLSRSSWSNALSSARSNEVGTGLTAMLVCLPGRS
jgi:hypothetical protein